MTIGLLKSLRPLLIQVETTTTSLLELKPSRFSMIIC